MENLIWIMVSSMFRSTYFLLYHCLFTISSMVPIILFDKCVFDRAGGTQRLPRLVGKAKAMELIFTGQKISGPTALSIGTPLLLIFF